MNTKKVLIVITIGLFVVGCTDSQRIKYSQRLGGPGYPTLVRVVGQTSLPSPVVVSPPPPTAQVPTARVSTTPLTAVSLTREVYVSGGLRSEVKWAVIRQLRALGYQVTTKSSKAPLRLRIRMSRRGNINVCTAILYNQDGQVIAQGQGESKYWYLRVSGRYVRLRAESLRYEAEIKAALEAIQSMAADYY